MPTWPYPNNELIGVPRACDAVIRLLPRAEVGTQQESRAVPSDSVRPDSSLANRDIETLMLYACTLGAPRRTRRSIYPKHEQF